MTVNRRLHEHPARNAALLEDPGHDDATGQARHDAIYCRDGLSWVARFRDGCGELSDAASWFRVRAGLLRSCRVGSVAAVDGFVEEGGYEIEGASGHMATPERRHHTHVSAMRSQ